jgi:peptidyl-prolyl cis-trans isomerase SurA
MKTRARAAWSMAMALGSMCAAAQNPAAPQTGTVAQSTQSTPVAPGQPPLSTPSGQGPGRVQIESRTIPPKENKLAPENGGLTFLPELKPTDGVVNLAAQKSGEAQLASEAAALHEKPELLDRAIAVINGEMIMASDVHEEQQFAVFEPYSVPGGEFTPLEAMQHIVNRKLLLDQMQDQQLVQPPSDAEVDKQIEELRKHIPACARQGCETDAGWRRFLAAHGFTEQELHERWKERMQILEFVSARFRTGIHITKPEIETYYKEKLVPAFEARKLNAPPLAQVSNRIEEVLLQQHVNVLLGDYLRSLKDAGSVLILDPQYNSLGNAPSSAASSGTGGDFPAPSRRGSEP